MSMLDDIGLPIGLNPHWFNSTRLIVCPPELDHDPPPKLYRQSGANLALVASEISNLPSMTNNMLV